MMSHTERQRHERAKVARAIALVNQRDGADDVHSDWTETLQKNRNGEFRGNFANAVAALENHPDWRDGLAYDELGSCVVSRRPAPFGRVDRWDDQADRLTALWLQQQGINANLDIVARAVETVARRHAFDPLKDFLNSCKWDGVKRVDIWPWLYAGASQDPYTSAVGRRWLLSGIARAFQPGAKCDHVLVLEGRQGSGKSSLLRTLGGEFYSDQLGDITMKDSVLQLKNVWIMEVAELFDFSLGAVERTKAFITRLSDRYRPPYGRRVEEHPRRTIFAATTNLDSYLRDSTGARRFWPIRCGEIQIAKLEADREALLAEAVALYKAGARWWFGPEEEDLVSSAEQAQSDRYQSDAWQSLIETFVASRSDVSTAEILTGALDKATGQWTRGDEMRVGACLRVLGWERYKKGPNWRFRRK